MAGPKKETTIEIMPLKRGRLEVFVRGQSPLILNRMAEKAKQELLYPSKKKTRTARESTFKHQPMEEYRASVYRSREEKSDTLLVVPAVMFKGALKSAAVDMPDSTKAAIGRLTYVEGESVPIYGRPELYMTVVRNAGMGRTPDIRTRAIVPEWATKLTIVYQVPLLTERSVMNLLAAAGEIVGVGDYRPEKGAGSYGRFELVSEEGVSDIVATGVRSVQESALEKPDFYNAESEELYEWFVAEAARREMKVVA